MFINSFKVHRVLILVALLSACNQSEEPTPEFAFKKPTHFPEPKYTFENNPVTKEGFDLGKALFNEGMFSKDGTVSCASCHDQSVAFADPQHRLSIGIEGRIGERNAPQISNLAFLSKFFWDGGVVHVDFIPLNAISNPLEMDEDAANIIEKLEEHPDYPALFNEAFGSSDITTPRMLHALSQFMNMMVSADSKYDKYILKTGSLEEAELRGLSLFEANCRSCHAGVLFTDESFRNNGLDSEFQDVGRFRISEQIEDMGKFRVPSLRNVALTSPYMHDGRFKTLEEVLDHYVNGIEISETLDESLINGIALSTQEQVDIINFLNSLTDDSFISNPIFFK